MSCNGSHIHHQHHLLSTCQTNMSEEMWIGSVLQSTSKLLSRVEIVECLRYHGCFIYCGYYDLGALEGNRWVVHHYVLNILWLDTSPSQERNQAFLSPYQPLTRNQTPQKKTSQNTWCILMFNKGLCLQLCLGASWPDALVLQFPGCFPPCRKKCKVGLQTRKLSRETQVNHTKVSGRNALPTKFRSKKSLQKDNPEITLQ